MPPVRRMTPCPLVIKGPVLVMFVAEISRNVSPLTVPWFSQDDIGDRMFPLEYSKRNPMSPRIVAEVVLVKKRVLYVWYGSPVK